MVFPAFPCQLLRHLFWCVAALPSSALAGFCHSAIPHPDSIGQVRSWLMAERDLLLRSNALSASEKVPLLLRYGMYDAAASLQPELNDGTEASIFAKALFAYYHYDFQQAVDFVEPLLKTEGNLYREALQLRIALHIAAWELDKAQQLGESRLATFLSDKIFLYWLGLVCFHKSELDKAKNYAQQALAAAPALPEAYELLALVAWWEGEYITAGNYARLALQGSPGLADARFVLGYSQWTTGGFQSGYHQQWAAVLEFSPYHERVHSFLGTGYSPLSLGDYQALGHGLVDNVQVSADSLWARGDARQAMGLLQNAQSVQGKLHKASLQYLGLFLPQPTSSPGEVLRQFAALSKEAPFYGPAHNGVAATLRYMKLGFAKANPIRASQQNMVDWSAIFPDLGYYRHTLLADQLGGLLSPAADWQPLLSSAGITMRLPPLHKHLAQVLGDTSFLHGFTHDHRKWMDIRAVSSGATGVEWIFQGFLNGRNVVLHELVHLVHHYLFTQQQKEAMALLFDRAKAENTLLDRYSAHNVYEFFAQGFTAYHTPEAVHPLQPKEANTHEALRTKSPALFAWIERWEQGKKAGKNSLLREQELALQINQLRKQPDKGPEAILPFLNKVLTTYPCLFEAQELKLQVHLLGQEFTKALQVIGEMEKCGPENTVGTQLIKIAYQEALFAAGKLLASETARQQWRYYQEAWQANMSTEKRLSLLGKIIVFLETFALLHELMAFTDNLTFTIPGLLEDIHPAVSRALGTRTFYQGTWGGEGAGLDLLAELHKHYPMRLHAAQCYGYALLAKGRFVQAFQVFKEMRYRYLQQGLDADWFTVRMAVALCRQQQFDEAKELLGTLRAPIATLPAETLLSVCQVYVGSGQTGLARAFMSGTSFPKDPATWSLYLFTTAMLLHAEGNLTESRERARAALEANPYHWEARLLLMESLVEQGKAGRKQAKALLREAQNLPYPLGNALVRKAKTDIFSKSP